MKTKQKRERIKVVNQPPEVMPAQTPKDSRQPQEQGHKGPTGGTFRCIGFAQLAGILKSRREREKWSVLQLARRAGVETQAVEMIEKHDVSVRLCDLTAIAGALKCHLSLELVPTAIPLPKSNADILAEYDRLVKRKGKFVAFLRNVADLENRILRWDVVGDPDRNWLYVVVSSRGRKVRFAAVTDAPGGWSIAGQLFGMDTETQTIADEMAQRLFREHHAKLVE